MRSMDWRRHSLRRASLLGGCVLVVAVVLAIVAESLQEPARIQVFGSLADVRPGLIPRPAAVSTTASLSAARNELESFQIAVESEGSPLRGVSVTTDGPLVGPHHARIGPGNLTIYREGYYDVRTPSDREGATGLWPDPLIPSRDVLYGERRNAFPAGAPGGGDVVAWVDVFVPPSQLPGTYRGSVAVAVEGGRTVTIPLRLRVLTFGLPSTTSLHSAFGLVGTTACDVLDGSGPCDRSSRSRWMDEYLFGRLALENRLTLSDAATADGKPPRGESETRSFQRYSLPLIGGDPGSPVGGPPARLKGARLTSIAVRGATYPASGHPALYGCATIASPCLARWRRLATRHGFADRLFVYLCDEPWVDPPRRWPVCKRAARGVTAGPWPGASKLVTTWIQDARANRGTNAINTITVPIDRMANKPGFAQAGDQRPAYSGFLDRPRRSLWLYTFCDQYGCRASRTPGTYWTGWPGYGIDQPPSQARAMGWLSFAYGASGELYYSVDSHFSSAWTSSYDYGGNGDGTLFYPGLPAGDPSTGAPAIGGRDPIPIESIRLKRIRDGREDYEYLRLAARSGQRGPAMAIVRGLVGSRDAASHEATFSPGAVDAARRRLARLIDSGTKVSSGRARRTQ